MTEKREVKNGISQAVDILKVERNRIQHIIELLEGNTTVREVDRDQPRGTHRSSKSETRKKPSATIKRTYQASHKHIRTVLGEAGKPLTPYNMSRLLCDNFNIRVTEAALKQTLKSDGGRTFCEPEDGLWGLVK